MEVKTLCPTCNTQFTRKTVKSIYCSGKCRLRSWVTKNRKYFCNFCKMPVVNGSRTGVCGLCKKLKKALGYTSEEMVKLGEAMRFVREKRFEKAFTELLKYKEDRNEKKLKYYNIDIIKKLVNTNAVEDLVEQNIL